MSHTVASDRGTDRPLRAGVFAGLRWKAASSLALPLTRLVGGLVLARLLSPHDYGLAGMVLVFSALVLVFSDLALGAALIQRPVLTERDRSTVFWLSAGTGLLLTILGIALSGPLAAFYGQPKVRLMFAAMSLSFLVAALSSTQVALLTREMNFRALELRKMCAAFLSLAAGISLAALGAGAWALIAQQLTVVLVSTILVWRASDWRPAFIFSLQSLRSFGGYSGNVFGSRLLFYLNRNVDNVLVGRFVGPAALGVYSLAYNLMLLPFDQISLPAQDVLFPAFSRMQDDPQRLTRAWFRANRLVGSVTVPMLVGLAIVAPDFVAGVLGHRWHSVAPALQILCWVGLLQSLQGMNGSVLRARDRTSDIFRYSVIVTAGSIGAFILGLRWGVIGVCTAYAISSTIIEPYYTWLTARAAGTTLRAFLRSLAGVAQAATVMAVAMLAARLALIDLGAGPWLRLLGVVLVGSLVYVGACAWRAPEVRGEVAELIARRRAALAV